LGGKGIGLIPSIPFSLYQKRLKKKSEEQPDILSLGRHITPACFGSTPSGLTNKRKIKLG